MSDLQSAFDELELHDQSLALSTEALSALTEFLSEQKEQDDAFSALARAAHKSYQVSDPGSPTTAVGDDDDVAKEDTLDLDAQEPPAVKLSMKLFQEDWQLSQFWYDDATAEALANELLKQANGGMIVCVSAPTVFMFLKVVSLQRLEPPEYTYR